MSPFDDCPPGMTDGIDHRTVDALLTGAVAPDDAPPGYAGVASLVAALRAPASASERADTTGVVPAMSVAVREGAPEPALADRDTSPARRRRKRVLGRMVTAKLAAVATIALAGATAAGAAAGALPGPAQSAVAGALSHVGVSVPDDHGGPSGRVAAHARDADDDVLPASTAGLCRARFATAARNPAAPPPASTLDDLARDAHESVHDLCEHVAPGSTSGVAAGTTATTAPSSATDDRGRGAEPGDDRGQGVEPGDDRGRGVEPGDDRGREVEAGDDHGGRVTVTSPTTQAGVDDHGDGGGQSGPGRGGDGSGDGSGDGHGGAVSSSQSGRDGGGH